MEIKVYSPHEQVEPAVEFGLAPRPLPEILSVRQLVEVAPPPPPQAIEGILHQGCKMVLGGTSKSNKSWCLLDLAISVASGQKWWGRPCAKMPVVYLNFELHHWAITHRINSICAARPECQGIGDTLHVWNLRGYASDISRLRPMLEERLLEQSFGLVILDPAYKLLGERDENANGEIASLMNELEMIAQSSRAAIVVAHHFAKGDCTTKDPIDRMSGAGAWARDPDSLLLLTPHEEPDCFTVTGILRNLPRLEDFVVAWDFPVLRPSPQLNPEAIRRPQARNKVCTDRKFLDEAVGDKPRNFASIIKDAEDKLEMSRSTATRYLARMKEAGLVGNSGGLYWKLREESG